MHKLISLLSKQMRKSVAFTLQEILLTLAIIGVISTLLVSGFKIADDAKYPAMRAVFKNELATQLATMNAEKDIANFQSTAQFVEEFGHYYDISDVPKKNEEIFGKSYTDAGGDKVNIPKYDYQFKTNNGVSVKLSYVKQNNPITKFLSANTVDLASYDVSNAAMNYVTGVFDVNGAKGPNQIGVDMGIIMPAYILDKKSKEYFTFNSNNEIVVKSKDPSTDPNKKQETVVVNSKGEFQNTQVTTKIAECKEQNPNYTADDYGNCLCGLSKAFCAAQGVKDEKGNFVPMDLNAKSCACEYNVSCPKNQVLDSSGNCVCRVAFDATKCNMNYTVKEVVDNKEVPVMQDCACKCELGASLKCIANGGTWKDDTCECLCGSVNSKNSAESRCATVASNALSANDPSMSYSTADPDNFCTCKCKSAEEIQAIINKIEQTDISYLNGAEPSDEISHKCFNCKTPADSTLELKKNEKDGVCSANCEASAQAALQRISDYNDQHGGKNDFYVNSKIPTNNDTASCKPQCRPDLEKYCAGLSGGETGDICTYTTKRHTATNILENRFKACYTTFDKPYSRYTCDSNNLKFKADKQNCRCVVDLGTVIPEKRTVLYKENHKFVPYEKETISALMQSPMRISYAYHGYCYAEEWLCKYKIVGKRKVANNPNAGNPLATEADHPVVNLMSEECTYWWDPVMLIFNNNPSVPSNARAEVYPTAESLGAIGTTWVKTDGTRNYAFLIKLNNQASKGMQEKLFTDLDKATGFEELKEAYDTKVAGCVSDRCGNGVINELDDNFKNLGLWFDKNSNGVVDTGETETLDSNQITDIVVANLYNRVDTEGNAVSDPESIQSIVSSFYKGKKLDAAPAANKIGAKECWLRRLNDTKNDERLHLWEYKATRYTGGSVDINGVSTPVKETVTIKYEFNPARNTHTFVSGSYKETGKVAEPLNSNSVYNILKKPGVKIRRYYQVGNTFYEHVEYPKKILDVLFKSSDE